jgi:organic hydroperoxide reductase OsmC/OhrA
MGKMAGFLYSIEWSNPYTEPPVGMPRERARYFAPVQKEGEGARVPEELKALGMTGSGYSITIRAVLEPMKVKTEEELAKSRQKRLKRRMKKETPLFMEHFEKVELERNPKYYEGKSRYEAERQEVFKREREELEYLKEHPFEVLVTACNRA